MRIPGRMLRWLSAGILALAVLLVATASIATADTGTYRIDNYTVQLQPQNDGKVKITIQQSWVVLSGDIPWITVGLPNSHFSVQEHGGAAAKVRADNSSGWSGVRVDLDRDYRSGEKFQVEFSVLQSNLLERLTQEKMWRIVYTPGWYDGATIGRLRVSIASPVDIASYSSLAPPPVSTSGGVITWEKTDLSPGAHFTIVAQSTDGSFLTKSAVAIGNTAFPTTLVIVVGVILGLAVLVAFAVFRARRVREEKNAILITEAEKEIAADPDKRRAADKGFEDYVEKKHIGPDEQGRYYDRAYGDYITPVIWAAILMHEQDRAAARGSYFGGGGFFGGSGGGGSCVSSCACVSCACACACACAGGGAAGCARKSFHECRDCVQRAVKDS